MEIKIVDILILGAGWTSTFLLPLLEKESISHAATSTTGRDGTIKFVFDPTSSDTRPYEALPFARTILITFPLKGPGQSAHLHALYTQTHTHPSSPSPSVPSFNFLQLGSTGIWQIPDQALWLTRHSPYDATNDRAVAEDELRSLGGCVLNLSGLWGGARQPRDFVKRVIPDKEALRKKGSLHMVHGEDVARAIIALHGDFTSGQRWMLTDMFVYDWWSLALGWGSGGSDTKDKDTTGPEMAWVRELMIEQDIRALPRSMDTLGRCYDSREFWDKFGIAPVRAKLP